MNPRASNTQSPFSTQVLSDTLLISIGFCRSMTASKSLPANPSQRPVR